MTAFTVPAVLENLADCRQFGMRLLPADQIRRVEVTDARIDPNESGLLLPPGVAAALGLEALGPQPAYQANVGRTVLLTVQGRDCVMDVGEVADGSPVVIGRMPLLAMDWVIDNFWQKLVGNPDHGGEWMMDIL